MADFACIVCGFVRCQALKSLRLWRVLCLGTRLRASRGERKKERKKKVENLHLRNTDRLENQKKGKKEGKTDSRRSEIQRKKRQRGEEERGC